MANLFASMAQQCANCKQPFRSCHDDFDGDFVAACTVSKHLSLTAVHAQHTATSLHSQQSMPSTRPLHSTVSSPCPAHDHFTPQSAVHARHTTTLLHSQQSMPSTLPLYSTVSSPCPAHGHFTPQSAVHARHTATSPPPAVHARHAATSLHSQQASITDSPQSM